MLDVQGIVYPSNMLSTPPMGVGGRGREGPEVGYYGRENTLNLFLKTKLLKTHPGNQD